MRYLKAFENHDRYHTDIVNNKQFDLIPGSRFTYKGSNYQVIDVYDTAIKAKNENGWEGLINFNQLRDNIS